MVLLIVRIERIEGIAKPLVQNTLLRSAISTDSAIFLVFACMVNPVI